MFRTVPLSIIRRYSPYTQQQYMSCRFADSLQAGSGCNTVPARKLSTNLYDIPLLCVQWKTPDDGQRNCLKHVEFHSKNKSEKLVHVVGFIIRNLSRCTVTWTSKVSEQFMVPLLYQWKPAPSPPVPLDRRPGRCQHRFGHCEEDEKSVPVRNWTLVVQPIAWSL